MKSYNDILKTEYSERFDKIRKDAMVMSNYKYGSVKETMTSGCFKCIDTLELRLQAYKETGNTEFLADVANFAMMEFMFPQHEKAHYKATDSNESPGLIGMSEKQLKDEWEK